MRTGYKSHCFAASSTEARRRLMILSYLLSKHQEEEKIASSKLITSRNGECRRDQRSSEAEQKGEKRTKSGFNQKEA